MTAELTTSQRCALKKLREDTGADDLSIDTAKTIAAVDARYIPSSARVVFTMLKKVYPGNAAFIAEAKARSAVTYKALLSQEPTARQTANHIPWEDIIAWRDSDEFKALPIETRLLVGLYTYLPPVRLDYTPMTIVGRMPKTLADGMNYLVMTKKKARFVFHAYKTAKSYGDIITEAPPALFALLCEYLGERRTGFLFTSWAGAWREQTLSDKLRDIFYAKFAKNFGANGLRHSFITHEHKGMKSISTLKDVSRAMGHNIITHMAYRHISLE